MMGHIFVPISTHPRQKKFPPCRYKDELDVQCDVIDWIINKGRYESSG